LGIKRFFIKAKKDSELYILQEKFNEMINKLASQKNTINSIKEETLPQLEAKIQERTASLEESNAELRHRAI